METKRQERLIFIFHCFLIELIENRKSHPIYRFRSESQASQASDVGSIPIARSINLVDAVGLTGSPPSI
jgi:hypothetical protein